MSGREAMIIARGNDGVERNDRAANEWPGGEAIIGRIKVQM